jgi:hypothetical protein
MKIFKKLSILLLILSFQLSLKGQNESSFDTINFKILTNLKEYEVVKLRLVTIGCFHQEQGRLEFKKEKNIVTASFYADTNYDIFDGEKGNSPVPPIKTKILTVDDLSSFDSLFKKAFEFSKTGVNCSTSDYFTLYTNEKNSISWIVGLCKESFFKSFIDKVTK